MDFWLWYQQGRVMINVGNVDGHGLDQEMSGKSAFMELQQQGMGMGHPAYPIRSSYQPHHHPAQHGDSVFSNPQTRPPLGYPFHMNPMSPTSYNPPTGHPFSMPPYQSPSPSRDGKFLIFLCENLCFSRRTFFVEWYAF